MVKGILVVDDDPNKKRRGDKYDEEHIGCG